MGIFNSDSKLQKQQFSQQMSAQAEANDDAMSRHMADTSNIAYEPQVSAMFLQPSDKLFRMRFIPKLDRENNIVLNEQGDPVGHWVKEYGNYNEPIGDEQKCFVKEDRKLKFVDESLGTLVQLKGFRDTYYGKKENGVVRYFEMDNSFNHVEGLRRSILVGSRVSGDSGKLAKSQIVDSSAKIFREAPKANKKPFLGGLFG